MRAIFLIARRDLEAYFRTWVGYIILAVTLFADSYLFHAVAFSAKAQPSETILGWFFWTTAGVHVTAAIFLSMRMICEERDLGTLSLLGTSPLKDSHIIMGKYVGGLAFLALIALLSSYCPLLLLRFGTISFSHILTGYLGVFLISSTALALALLCSTIAPNQLVSVVLSASLVGLFILAWKISQVTEAPLKPLIQYFAFFDQHYRNSFAAGVLSLNDIVFYLSLCYVALVLATQILESRRWQ